MEQLTEEGRRRPESGVGELHRSPVERSLLDVVVGLERLAMVGLAKNTGKTVALTALLAELNEQGVRVGVTSVGRDGEDVDVIDMRIEKPRVRLAAGSLLATTDRLLRASGLPYELVHSRGARTPLGNVVVARLLAAGTIEVAGPSAAADVRAVSDVMLDHGAERVLIDGAIDRRAASSPAVSDGLIMSTGAVLAEEIEHVVAHTKRAVELVRLPTVSDEALREQAICCTDSVLVDRAGNAVSLPARFALSATEHELKRLMGANPCARGLVIRGAVCEPFLQTLIRVVGGEALEVVATDATKVFLSQRASEWYRRLGITLSVLRPVRLAAITVNPLAPNSHEFDSLRLRELLQAEIPDVPVLDVLAPGRLPLAA